MRESISKKIRQVVFKDMSRKGTKYARTQAGAIVCVGLRARYKETKKEYNTLRRKLK